MVHSYSHFEKTRSGDEAPAFVVEVSYLDRAASWTDKGRTRVSLVAVDLPISKSHLLLHHPPLFRVTPVPGASGSFRVATYAPPNPLRLRSEASPSSTEQQQAEGEIPPTIRRPNNSSRNFATTTRGSRPARNRPLRVVFPHFGPSIFLVSELTGENQTPAVEFDFQRDRKRGDAMKALILILLITDRGRRPATANTTVYTPLPAPGPRGTVTLSLSEYNRLVELATRKAKTPDGVPLPLSRTPERFRLPQVRSLPLRRRGARRWRWHRMLPARRAQCLCCRCE